MKYLSVLLLAVVGIATVTAHYGHHGMYRGYGSMYGMGYGYPRFGYGSLYGGYGGMGYGYGGIGYGSMYGGYGYPYGGISYGSMYGGLGYGGYRRFGGYGNKYGKYPRYISNKKYGYGY
ncbi:keratin-associated protein 19-2-like [Ruditapes philippinarum]|uniref:keratin-associated protein 19-2-like n=1 Tax=Ruditapes philippinarum TaxID=129788 RepID=UPI00295B2CD0|nr:keratin-associated protein 19-2-like [Ruditapes philippinarum]